MIERNEPEFTTVRLADGTDPSTVIARVPNGFQDAAQTTTTWFTDAKPAEIRQLDAAMPYLRGSLVVGYAALLAVAAHALWTRARANRHDLAVLRAVGCTGRQLDAVTAWQALPAAVAALVIGIPLGIALGRWTFPPSPARSPSSTTPRPPPLTVGTLVVAVLVAVGDRRAARCARRPADPCLRRPPRGHRSLSASGCPGCGSGVAASWRPMWNGAT